MGVTIRPSPLSTSTSTVQETPKPVRSVQRAMAIGFAAADAALGGDNGGRRRLPTSTSPLNSPLNIVLHAGVYSGFDVCNAVVQEGRNVRIGSLSGREKTRLDCQSTGRFMRVVGAGTSVELIGLTLAGGATITNATGSGSLLLVSSGASLLGRMLQMSQSKNAPSLVCQGLDTSCQILDMMSSVHSDGAVLVHEQATLVMRDATFTNISCTHDIQ